MTHSPKPPSRAEALVRLKRVREWQKGGPETPTMDPYQFLFGWDDRKGEKAGCIDLIEAALATDAPIVEGFEEERKK